MEANNSRLIRLTEHLSGFCWGVSRNPVLAICGAMALFSASVVAQSTVPVRGFVSVEPYELRLEALVRPSAFQAEWEMEDNSMDSKEQGLVLKSIADQFSNGVSIEVSGEPIAFDERTVRFVVLDPEKGYVEDTREEIPIEAALVGMTFSASASDIFSLDINWNWFAPGQIQVPVEVSSSGRPVARYATPQKKRIRWVREGDAESKQMTQVPSVMRVKESRMRVMWIPGLLLILGGLVIMGFKRRKTPAVAAWLVIGGVACCFVSYKWKTDRVVVPEDSKLEELVYALLKNVYHAFDFRDESDIYDALDHSISGDLLERVYLEIRGSLELENAGGPRVRVHEVALRGCALDSKDPAPDDQFKVVAEWVTIGEVTHWGHTHERTNRYEARLSMVPVGTQWKVSELELLSEEREQKVSRRDVASDS